MAASAESTQSPEWRRARVPLTHPSQSGKEAGLKQGNSLTLDESAFPTSRPKMRGFFSKTIEEIEVF